MFVKATDKFWFCSFFLKPFLSVDERFPNNPKISDHHIFPEALEGLADGILQCDPELRWFTNLARQSQEGQAPCVSAALGDK